MAILNPLWRLHSHQLAPKVIKQKGKGYFAKSTGGATVARQLECAFADFPHVKPKAGKKQRTTSSYRVAFGRIKGGQFFIGSLYFFSQLVVDNFIPFGYNTYDAWREK